MSWPRTGIEGSIIENGNIQKYSLIMVHRKGLNLKVLFPGSTLYHNGRSQQFGKRFFLTWRKNYRTTTESIKSHAKKLSYLKKKKKKIYRQKDTTFNFHPQVYFAARQSIEPHLEVSSFKR